jgi:hypothetical protein
VAQAGPAPAKPASQARPTAAGPAAGPSSSYALDAKGAVPLVAAGITRHGCPYYYACMYTTSGWSNNTPEHEYYYYGCYALSNEYGTRWIYDNQSDHGDIAGMSTYSCNGLQWAVAPGGWGKVNITPVNSVELYQG